MVRQPITTAPQSRRRNGAGPLARHAAPQSAALALMLLILASAFSIAATASCPASTAGGVFFPATAEGTYAVSGCPVGSTGTTRRLCCGPGSFDHLDVAGALCHRGRSGEWMAVDPDGCTNAAVATLAALPVLALTAASTVAQLITLLTSALLLSASDLAALLGLVANLLAVLRPATALSLPLISTTLSALGLVTNLYSDTAERAVQNSDPGVLAQLEGVVSDLAANDLDNSDAFTDFSYAVDSTLAASTAYDIVVASTPAASASLPAPIFASVAGVSLSHIYFAKVSSRYSHPPTCLSGLYLHFNNVFTRSSVRSVDLHFHNPNNAPKSSLPSSPPPPPTFSCRTGFCSLQLPPTPRGLPLRRLTSPFMARSPPTRLRRRSTSRCPLRSRPSRCRA